MLCLIFITALPLGLPAQETGEPVWPESLNTARNAGYLTEAEREVVFEMNKVRSDPSLYAWYLRQERQYYFGNQIKRPLQMPVLTREGLVALDECIAFLENVSKARPLRPHEGLTKASRRHAADQAETGETGHDGSDGSTIPERISETVWNWIKVAENINYGDNNARSIIISLLIDDNVPDRGHRYTLLDPELTHCGVAIDRHPDYRYSCVIDYASFFR